MAGYIGTKAVLLSTTAATVTGNADIGGDLTVDSNTLYVDSANDLVGIGTSSPSFASAAFNGLEISYSTIPTLRLTDTSNTSFDIFKNGLDVTLVNRDAGYLRFDTSNSERMRIDSSGNVGIGVTPSAWNSAFDAVQVGRSTALWSQNNYDKMWLTTNAYLDASGNFKYISSAPVTSYNQVDGTHRWGYASSGTAGNTATLVEAARIDSSGNLLVGTTDSNKAKVYAVGANPTLNAVFATSNGTNGYVALSLLNASASQVGYIYVGSSSTSYNTTSDYRLKEDIQPMVGASGRVLALKPVNFAWKADGTRVDGFLAHEAQEVVPEAVTGTKDAMREEEYEVSPAVHEDVIIPAVLDADGNEVEPERTEQRLVSEAVMGTREVPDYQGIDQSKLVPLLTAALQEALTKIDDLETRIAALETA